jgi:hypothetical protein
MSVDPRSLGQVHFGGCDDVLGSLSWQSNVIWVLNWRHKDIWWSKGTTPCSLNPRTMRRRVVNCTPQGESHRYQWISFYPCPRRESNPPTVCHVQCTNPWAELFRCTTDSGSSVLWWKWTTRNSDRTQKHLLIPYVNNPHLFLTFIILIYSLRL